MAPSPLEWFITANGRIRWGGLTAAVVGGIITTFFQSVIAAILGLFQAIIDAASGLTDFILMAIAQTIGVPTTAVAAAFQAPLSTIETSGILGFALGIAVAASALYVASLGVEFLVGS